MIFNEGNYLVQLCKKDKEEDGFRREDVPNLFNLREVVYGGVFLTAWHNIRGYRCQSL